MTARRSDDPTADAAAPDAASSLEYWTKERRDAANPVPMTREVPTESEEDRVDRTLDPPSTCNDTGEQEPGTSE